MCPPNWFGVWGLGFGSLSLGFGVWGLGFRVPCFVFWLYPPACASCRCTPSGPNAQVGAVCPSRVWCHVVVEGTQSTGKKGQGESKAAHPQQPKQPDALSASVSSFVPQDIMSVSNDHLRRESLLDTFNFHYERGTPGDSKQNVSACVYCNHARFRPSCLFMWQSRGLSREVKQVKFNYTG